MHKTRVVRSIAAAIWITVTSSHASAGDPCTQDGACNISCVPTDPDCTNLDICIATGFCCVGDGSCTIDCPMPDPDCSDDALCAFYAYCCPDDGFCDGICHSPDRDCCTLGCNAKVHVECLNPSPQYTNSRAVANIDTAPGSCTGWMIAAPNFMMTNRHCVTTDGTAYGPLKSDVTVMTAHFDDECSACEGSAAKPRVPIPVTGLILSDPLRDFALLTLEGDPASLFGTLPVNCGGPGSGTSVYLIHHAVGQKKAYDEGSVYEVQLDQSCGGQYILGQAKYTLLSKGGASGAPVFDAVNHDVIAIHHCGTGSAPECVDDGKGIPMSLVLPYVLPVISAFGGVAAVTEECACPGTTSCCTSGISPGCDDAFCCSMTCTIDPYCCETEWDTQCKGEAESNPLCGCPVCGDGVCDTGESPCDCPSDCGGCCSASECDDQNPCTDDSCNLDAGCVNINNAAICNDGDPCTENDACSGGVCSGTSILCDDANPCTDDICSLGVCLNFANSAFCDDDDDCTSGDMCSEGACSGTPIQGCSSCDENADCDDGSPCTTDVCAGGVCIHSLEAGPCDDGDPCTSNDICSGGVCSGNPIVCDDGNDCTDDMCLNGQCLFSNNMARCDDGNDCTDDNCVDGVCVPTDNDDLCDDADACTMGDTCSGGECVGTPVVCDDGNPCTDDSCDAVLGCQAVPNIQPCDDSDACTVGDACSGGACVGMPVVCDDGNPCTDDTCNPATGSCELVNNSIPCDDGQNCTENDVCSGGQCIGTPIPGCTDCVSSEDCDDGNLCTTDTCVGGVCSYSDNVSMCDDGKVCTENDVCSGGSCDGIPIPGCFSCTADADCDDGNPCTDDSCISDTCSIESVLFDLNGDGLSTVVGDLNDLVNCIFFTAPGDLDTCCTAGNCMCRADCNRDGLLTVTGDLQCWVDCFFLGVCDEP